MTQVVEITPALRVQYNNALLAFEKHFQYPFGTDTFTLNHGQDYFAFFDRLGRPYIFAAVNDMGEVVAVMGAVLRDLSLIKHQTKQKIWYLCDLKIHPDYQHSFILFQLIEAVYKRHNELFNTPPKIYGISMDAKKFSPNKLIRMGKSLAYLGIHLDFNLSDHLLFYLLDSKEIEKVKNLIQPMYENFQFITLSGIKDLILSSTQKPLPFLHFSPDTSENLTVKALHPEYGYLFCFPVNHPAVKIFEQCSISCFTTASVISNMQEGESDWAFIETCDI